MQKEIVSEKALKNLKKELSREQNLYSLGRCKRDIFYKILNHIHSLKKLLGERIMLLRNFDIKYTSK